MGFFNSPVQDAIEKATSTQLVEADWATNMEIWEMINRDEDGYGDKVVGDLIGVVRKMRLRQLRVN